MSWSGDDKEGDGAGPRDCKNVSEIDGFRVFYFLNLFIARK